MDLNGYGCSGFSYTSDKKNGYKKPIVDIYDYIENYRVPKTVKYDDFQKAVANKNICDGCKTRMIIPFLVKAGIINKEKCKGKKITELILDSDFFTHYGKCFIQYLRIDLKRSNFNNNGLALKYLDDIKFRLSCIQLIHLCKNDPAYNDVIEFIKKYKSIDKTEFYILATYKKNNRMDELEKVIANYRASQNNNYNIKSNVNDFQYIKAQLKWFKICDEDKLSQNKIIFSKKYKKYLNL